MIVTIFFLSSFPSFCIFSLLMHLQEHPTNNTPDKQHCDIFVLLHPMQELQLFTASRVCHITLQII